MNSPQNTLQNVLDRLVTDDVERGLQLAVYHEGKLVIDCWSGFADEAREKPVGAHTIFPVFSATKGVFSTVIHRLVDRGLLEYDRPLAVDWPEFGVNGKDGITLRHVLTHSAGVPQIPESLDIVALGDWERTCAAIAELTPMWVPGTAQAYHAVTMGYLMGELARRVTGKMPGQLIEEEIQQPAGIEDMYLGVPDSEEPRVAWLEEIGPEFGPDAASPAIPMWLWPLHGWMNLPEGHKTPNPASNGIMSARALARHYAALVPGGVDGVELLSPERVKIASQRHLINNDPEQSLGFALGYGTGGEGALGPRRSAFGHGGYGGTQAFADPEVGLSVGFTRNRTRNVNTEVDTVALVVGTVREELGIT